MANKKLQRKWIHNLESGEFIQGYSRLKWEVDKVNNKYCCLGVACSTKDPSQFSGSGMFYGLATANTAAIYGMSTETVKTFGLTEDDARQLVGANDSREYSFMDIAQVLRCWFEIWD